MKYKRKGIDFCAYPGCMRQDYGGEIGELRYCAEHIQGDLSETVYQLDLAAAKETARRQGVEFGKFAVS